MKTLRIEATCEGAGDVHKDVVVALNQFIAEYLNTKPLPLPLTITVFEVDEPDPKYPTPIKRAPSLLREARG